jgi:hypothetical protein
MYSIKVHLLLLSYFISTHFTYANSSKNCIDQPGHLQINTNHKDIKAGL